MMTSKQPRVHIGKVSWPLGGLLDLRAALLLALGLTSCRDQGLRTPAPPLQRTYYNLSYASVSPANKLDLYLPQQGTGPFPLVVWIHGGGWMSGDKAVKPTDTQMSLLSRNIALASIEYRFSPEAVFPAQIYDVKAALRWLRAHARPYRLDPHRFAVWGASAGGHLAALAGTSAGVADLEDLTMGNADYPSDVQVVVDWFGPTDLLRMNAQWPSFCRPYDNDAPSSCPSLLVGAPLRTVPERVKRANPLTYVSPRAPVILIAHGLADCQVPAAQSQILYAALSAAGVRATLNLVQGAGHGDVTFYLSQAPVTIDFLDEHLHAQ